MRHAKDRGDITDRGAAAATEGIRERKKRLTRDLISNTATRMFLAHGFDAVKVTDIARACDVAEKTGGQARATAMDNIAVSDAVGQGERAPSAVMHEFQDLKQYGPPAGGLLRPHRHPPLAAAILRHAAAR